MYMKLEKAVEAGVRLDAGTDWFWDGGEVVVYVEVGNG